MPLSPPPSPAPGALLAGRYRFERWLGRGGAHLVCLATDVRADRAVALKLPATRDLEPRPARHPLLAEADALDGLAHPHVVRRLGVGSLDDGRPLLALEPVDGQRLDLLLGPNRLEPARALPLLRQVARALRHCHARGVVHADLKPANLLVGVGPQRALHVTLIDFGLAVAHGQRHAASARGRIAGSPHSVSPEQLLGARLDGRADLYAFGVLLFRLLTGAYPFHGPDADATRLAHLRAPLPRLADVAPALAPHQRLEQLTRRCLARDRGDRFPHADALLDALDAL